MRNTVQELRDQFKKATENMDYDRAVVLGGIFGELTQEVERLQNEREGFIKMSMTSSVVQRLQKELELANDGIELLKEEKASLIMHLEKIVEDYRTRPHTGHRDAYIVAKDSLKAVGVEVG